MAAVNYPSYFEVAGNRVDLDGKALPSEHEIAHEVPEEIKSYDEKRKAGEAFDATVVIKKEPIPAHQSVLARSAQYFVNVFNADMAEAKSGQVELEDCEYWDAAVLKNLIDYCYTGTLKITENNVQDLFAGSNYLQIGPIMDECAQFMRKRLTVCNVLPIYGNCDSVGYKKIDNYIFKFLDKNFVAVSQTPDFLRLTVTAVEKILQRDSLFVESEEQVFNAVSAWMAHDGAERAQYAERLLRSVRCTRLTIAFIEEAVESAPWIAGNDGCAELLKEAKTFINSDKSEERATLTSFVHTSRFCENAHNLIVPVGNLTNTSNPGDSTMSFYDPISNSWSKCPNLPAVRTRNGVALVGKTIYAIGGFDGKERLKTCTSFDLATNTWTDLPSWELQEARAAMACGVIDGAIIIAGGFNGSVSLKTVQAISPAGDKPEWKELTELTKLRGAPASCVLNGKLYVIGGHDGQQIFADGEYYDPANNTWTEIAPMKHKRCRFGAAVLDGKIYVAGGFNGAEFLKSVERYDPATNKWEQLKESKIRRSRSSLAVSCGKLFVFGGFDGLNNIAKVSMYDPETDCWLEREPMPSHAGGMSICALPIPCSHPSPVANLERADIPEATEEKTGN